MKIFLSILMVIVCAGVGAQVPIEPCGRVPAGPDDAVKVLVEIGALRQAIYEHECYLALITYTNEIQSQIVKLTVANSQLVELMEGLKKEKEALSQIAWSLGVGAILCGVVGWIIGSAGH